MNHLIDGDDGSHPASPKFTGNYDDFVEKYDCDTCHIPNSNGLIIPFFHDFACIDCLKKSNGGWLINEYIKSIGGDVDLNDMFIIRSTINTFLFGKTMPLFIDALKFWDNFNLEHYKKLNEFKFKNHKANERNKYH